MLARVLSGTTIGLEGVLIEVEVDVASRGFPTVTIVGLPDKGIDEAKDRVRTAIVNTSFEMPESRITVNLAPADIPKEGPQYDLPIAVGILSAGGLVKKDGLLSSLFLGELSLEGNVRKVTGTLSVAFLARKKNIGSLFVPWENVEETALVDDIVIYPVKSLAQLILHLNGLQPISPYVRPPKDNSSTQFTSMTFPRSKDSYRPSGRWKLPRLVFTIFTSRVHPGRAKPCFAAPFLRFCRRLRKKKYLKWREFIRWSVCLNKDWSAGFPRFVHRTILPRGSV